MCVYVDGIRVAFLLRILTHTHPNLSKGAIWEVRDAASGALAREFKRFVPLGRARCFGISTLAAGTLSVELGARLRACFRLIEISVGILLHDGLAWERVWSEW